MRPGQVAADRYDELPEAIKARISEKEWNWLPDERKARLILDETEPDHTE